MKFYSVSNCKYFIYKDIILPRMPNFVVCFFSAKIYWLITSHLSSCLKHNLFSISCATLPQQHISFLAPWKQNNFRCSQLLPKMVRNIEDLSQYVIHLSYFCPIQARLKQPPKLPSLCVIIREIVSFNSRVEVFTRQAPGKKLFCTKLSKPVSLMGSGIPNRESPLANL